MPRRPSYLPPVDVYKRQLLNYAVNAVKFTAHGAITIRTRVVESASSSLLVRFEVEDTGIGVDPEVRLSLIHI